MSNSLELVAEYNGQSKKKWLFPANRYALNGFEKGYLVEKILGATDENGCLEFAVKWKNVDHMELISSKLAYEKCPQEVIDFYEKHCTWHTIH